jgi:Flp pilus assembly protein CpaB
MNAKAIIPLIIGLGIAGFAAKLGLDFIKNAEGKQAKMVKLWTPVEDIKRGVAIDEAMIKPLAFPLSAVPEGALGDAERIVGRVPHTGAPAGVPILDSMLLPPGVNAGVRVPPGLRAVAVKVDESSGVDYHLEPGCHVDVVGLFTIRRGNRAESVARTVLEDVEVAAVGQRLAPTAPTPEDAQGRKSSKRERAVRAVTLLVKPAQVPTLHLAEQKGAIKLAMRSTFDQSYGGEPARAVEGDLLGVEKPQAKSAPSSWGEQFNEFVSSFWDKKQVEPDFEPENVRAPASAPDEQPKLAWVMAVYNGDERRLLGWTEFDNFRPVELSSDGPNVFRGDSRFAPPGSGSQTGWKLDGQSQANPPVKAESKLQPEPASGTDAELETKFEPEELFE